MKNLSLFLVAKQWPPLSFGAFTSLYTTDVFIFVFQYVFVTPNNYIKKFGLSILNRQVNMGVPKFFRWISERYPKINQRYGSPPNPETVKKYFDTEPNLDALEKPDPLSTCGLPPEIDRLYLDMNGIM
jgi:hypothetical protein